MTIWNYVLLALIAGYFVRRWYGFRSVKRQLPQLIEKGAVIVDVRSPAEFESGHASGSINIPLHRLSEGAKKLDPDQTVVLCCASGTRSAAAVSILKNQGFKKVLNGGPWAQLQGSF